MTKTTSSGRCRLCGRLLGKAQMSRHLNSCLKSGSAVAPNARGAACCFHLLVEAVYAPAYWLHLEVLAKTTFGQLDRALRDIWLECCGHMSAFRFPRKRLFPASSGNIAQMFAAPAPRGFEDEMDEEQRLMRVQIGKRLSPGSRLEYEYDFGSTTEVSIRALGERSSPLPKPRIRLLARNEPPDIRCGRCGKPATEICTECDCSGEGALCKSCALNHECGSDMLLPVVNSPRTGICGYTGPSIEP